MKEYKYKIVIVDDDEIIRQGIEKNIKWEENGFQVVAIAENGIEGLEFVKFHKPHIVITDIRMPFMNGLEMVEKINELYPRTKAIFLTAYEDFEYAKKAVNLKANEYILKYADNQEILNAVIKARDELLEEKKLREKSAQGSLLLKNKFLGDLVRGMVAPDLFQTEVKFLNISFPGNRFCVAMLDIDGNQKERLSNMLQGKELQLKSLLKLFNDIILNNEILLPFIHLNNYICIISSFNENFGEANEFLADLLEEIRENAVKGLEINLSIGVGNLYDGYQNIQLSYNEAIQALEMRSILNKTGIIPIDSVRYNENSQIVIFRQIVDYVDHNYNKENLTLNSIAKEVHISHTYICTLFKKYMDISYSDYLIRVRVEKAKELIRNTNLKTYEVAEKIGYSNPQYFSVLFKRCTGLSPTDYRNQSK